MFEMFTLSYNWDNLMGTKNGFHDGNYFTWQ